MTTTHTTDAVTFMAEHAGYSYDPVRETAEEGRRRCAEDLARAEEALRADPDVFVVWQVDDIDSSLYEDTDDPHPLYCALLCVDCERDGSHLTRGYDPRDGIFERYGRIVGCIGGIDIHPPHPYARVVAAELYSEFEREREACIVRGDS